MSKEWKDGIPNAGSECEYCLDPISSLEEVWQFCIFIGRVNDEDFVLPIGGTVDRMKAIEPERRFRPIQTQADKERGKAIDRLNDIIDDPDRAMWVYDAGYRLPVEQGETVSGSDLNLEYGAAGDIDIVRWLVNNFIITRKPNV
jgi:hypothetical protein